MAVTNGTFILYDNALKNIQEGVIAIESASSDLIVLLATSTYAPDVATDEFIDDVTNELSGSGYSRQTLTGVTFAKQVDDSWMLDANNPEFSAIGGNLTARYFVVAYNVGAGDADKPLIGFGLLDATPADVVTTDGNTLTINFNELGLYRLAKAA